MRTITAFTWFVVTALVAVVVEAAPAEKIREPAGPPPSDAQAHAAIVKYFQSRNQRLNASKPFKVLSGPTLATGNTFAGGIEQAWLMCIVVNAERTSPGPQELQGMPLYLKTKAGQLTVVRNENWKDSSPQCT